MAELRCSICHRPALADGPSFPFCSPRCRSIDFGRWFGERYRVPVSAAAFRSEAALPDGSYEESGEVHEPISGDC